MESIKYPPPFEGIFIPESKQSDSSRKIHQTWRDHAGLQAGDTPLEDLPRLKLIPNSEVAKLARKQPSPSAQQPLTPSNPKELKSIAAEMHSLLLKAKREYDCKNPYIYPSNLLDEAIEDLLKKYEKKPKK
jgi:hypothetical protein